MAAEGSELTRSEPTRSEPTRIMVAVNQSSIKGYPHPSISSKGAFEWTMKKIVRSNPSGFKILLLHVQIPDADGFGEIDGLYAGPEDFRTMMVREKLIGLYLLEYFVQQCHKFGVACAACLKRGNPKEIICQEVKNVQPDFLVMGSRGLGPFQKVFVGTVSEFCTKHADCPVISIKRNAAEIPQDPADD